MVVINIAQPARKCTWTVLPQRYLPTFGYDLLNSVIKDHIVYQGRESPGATSEYDEHVSVDTEKLIIIYSSDGAQPDHTMYGSDYGDITVHVYTNKCTIQ